LSGDGIQALREIAEVSRELSAEALVVQDRRQGSLPGVQVFRDGGERAGRGGETVHELVDLLLALRIRQQGRNRSRTLVHPVFDLREDVAQRSDRRLERPPDLIAVSLVGEKLAGQAFAPVDLREERVQVRERAVQVVGEAASLLAAGGEELADEALPLFGPVEDVLQRERDRAQVGQKVAAAR